MTSTTTKAIIDSDANFSTVTENFAKQMGWKINEDTSSQDINGAVSGIVKQVSGKKIWISLHRLLEIVKPEIQQDIMCQRH